jgi:hypothetical protein
MNLKKTFLLLLCAVTVPAAAATRPDAIGVIAPLFDRYDVIGIPEYHHSAENHVFLRQLLVDPRVAGRINDVVVEAGNARYQDLADRYVVRGEDVPLPELRKIWRDTTMIMSFDSPLYQELLETMRTLNATLPAARRIRVLLGDPPIPWENVKTRADYERWADRDLFYAGIVDREVFAKHHKALLIVGGTHLLYTKPQKEPLSERRLSVADLLRRRHPDRFFAFWHAGQRLAPPSVAPTVAVVVKGSAFAGRSFAVFAPKGVLQQKVVDGKKVWVPLSDDDWPAVNVMTDGLIDYGPYSNSVEAPPETYCDAAYVTELRRRAAILKEVYGMSFDEQIDDAVKVCPH